MAVFGGSHPRCSSPPRPFPSTDTSELASHNDGAIPELGRAQEEEQAECARTAPARPRACRSDASTRGDGYARAITDTSHAFPSVGADQPATAPRSS